MLFEVYSIRDAGAEFYGAPFYTRAKGQALRDFSRVVQDPQTVLHANPEQYDLYYLGRFDDNSGKHDLLPTPQHVSKAIEHVKPETVVTP